ncbi:hypothetical protein ACLHFD_001996 [Vibrio alginolyticus]
MKTSNLLSTFCLESGLDIDVSKIDDKDEKIIISSIMNYINEDVDYYPKTTNEVVSLLGMKEKSKYLDELDYSCFSGIIDDLSVAASELIFKDYGLYKSYNISESDILYPLMLPLIEHKFFLNKNVNVTECCFIKYSGIRKGRKLHLDKDEFSNNLFLCIDDVYLKDCSRFIYLDYDLKLKCINLERYKGIIFKGSQLVHGRSLSKENIDATFLSIGLEIYE